MGKEEKKEKDKWDKVDIILKPVGGLLTAIAVSSLGLLGTDYLKKKEKLDIISRERMQTMESNMRLYSELMSKREEAESALRKDMLKSVIDPFFKPESAPTDSEKLEVKILNLELLVYNFHESVNLKPFFNHLKNQINTAKFLQDESQKKEYLTRLDTVARYIAQKQLAILELGGKIKDISFSFKEVPNSPNGEILISSTKEDEFNFEKDNIKRKFDVYLQDVDPKTKELKVRVVAWIKEKKPYESKEFGVDIAHAKPFWVGFFDLPMIDNTRLSHDQRYAIILNKFEESLVDITLVCFPGTYGSLKEKPYYEEIVHNLLNARKY